MHRRGCSHPYVQDQEHDKDKERAICGGQVWTARNFPNPGLILAKRNQTFYPRSPTDLVFVVQPMPAEETSNWKFRLKSKAVNLMAALE